MARKPTMRDIAKMADVSQTTVSFVLNENSNVSILDTTKKAVLESAEKLGYVHPYRRLGKNSARTIGFLIDEVATSALMFDFLEGATDLANQYGYQLPVIITRGASSAEEAALDAWQHSDLAGVIYGSIVTCPVNPSDRFGEVNTVLLNCHAKEREFVSILPGETLGGLRATTRLIEAGCRDIIHITGEPWLEATQKRIDGFFTGLATANIAADDKGIFCSTFSIQSGYENMKKVLSDRTCPEGIFCGNDWIAQGVYQALAEAGIRPGVDVKLVGYDNLFFSQHMAPPLTTINLPYRDMGRMAVEMIVEAGKAPLKGPHEVKMPCQLIERESV